jgi:hypothetical protein
VTLFDYEEPTDGIIRSARLSDDEVYRYVLGRRWADDGPLATFVMLNPSTADAVEDDRTIRRCIGFARDWGCVALHVLNLYAYRTKSPAVMWAAQGEGIDVVGPRNDGYLLRHIATACTAGWPLVAAWGAGAGQSRVEEVLAMPGARVAFQCLGRNANGSPKHPLYLPKSARLERYDQR